MTLNLAICDDNEYDCNELKSLLNAYSFQHHIDFHIEIFHSGNDLIHKYHTSNLFQVLLIDIEMPEESGIDIAEIIKLRIDHDVIIVFISNYPRYMQDSFKVHPYDFLQKPVNETQITKLMNDIVYDMEYNKTLVSIIDGYDNEYTIHMNDIYYIETTDAKNKELAFHLSERIIHAKGILTTWSNLLTEHAFHSCSRTTLVNLTHIHYINGSDIVLDNGKTITVSKMNKKLLLDNYLNQVVAIKRNGRR